MPARPAFPAERTFAEEQAAMEVDKPLDPFHVCLLSAEGIMFSVERFLAPDRVVFGWEWGMYGKNIGSG